MAKSEGRVAGELMSRPVVTIGPEEDLRLAARRMLTHRVKRLPVVDDHGRLVGIVSRADLLRMFDQSDEDLQVDISDCLYGPSGEQAGDEVRFGVHDGVVTLTATVSSASHERALVAAVRAVPGVVDVVGSLKRRHPG